MEAPDIQQEIPNDVTELVIVNVEITNPITLTAQLGTSARSAGEGVTISVKGKEHAAQVMNRLNEISGGQLPEMDIRFKTRAEPHTY